MADLICIAELIIENTPKPQSVPDTWLPVIGKNMIWVIIMSGEGGLFEIKMWICWEWVPILNQQNEKGLTCW